ncbi:MAG: hypothetical protein HQ471_00245 [Flavobacteriales bacterium]|jgi:tetratricopeptide (TPR) repeat protein|nr:hypothetical protein [Flavobacteriales bacterium]
MTLTEFNHILDNPNQINTTFTNKIEEVLEAYPFFQIGHVLHLKGLQNQDSFKFNTGLKKTAAYSTDRTVLFDFIINKKALENTQQEEIDSKEAVVKLHKNISTISKENTFKNVEESLQIGKPIRFLSNETHSFNEWLKLESFTPIKRKPYSENSELIEQFIKSNPKIKPIKSEPIILVSEEKIHENLDIMTETLAKVYLEQKKYAKAIKAYNILSLKYPEKSSFFADRIKAIKFLQKL